MVVQQLGPGLWRWTGLHPDWTPDQGGPNGWEQEVGCVCSEETILWIAEHGALVFGDVVLGAEGGGVRLCPESWLEGGTHAQLKAALRPLLDLPVERLLVSHGEPVLAGGRDALARALTD